MTLVADRIAQLKAAIAAQDQLRPAVGDEAVDAAVSVLQAQLDLLQAQDAPAVGDRPAATTEEEALSALQARVPAELADKARRTAAAPRSQVERRNITVLIADLHGFTGLGNVRPGA